MQGRFYIPPLAKSGSRAGVLIPGLESAIGFALTKFDNKVRIH